MNMTVPSPGHPSEVWFFTSELEGERASSHRQSRWCEIFLAEGARIRIFNVRGAFGLTEVTCSTLEDFNAFRQASLARARAAASVREGAWVGLVRAIKHLLMIDLYLPNVWKLVLRARQALQRVPGSVVLMGSSPPFSMALAAAAVKALHPQRVTLCVDMRDAWALHDALGGFKPVKRWIERRVLRRADHVSTVSHGLAREFKAHYGVDVRVMYNVATHYLKAAPVQPMDLGTLSPLIRPERLQVAYTGSTPVGFYDCASLVGGMKLLRNRDPQAADCIQLVLVGACDEVRREAERQQAAPGDFVFLPLVPHAVARSIQESATALLFLAYFGPDNKGVVSTKLFEYLCLGKPVLPVSLHEGSDVDMLLRRYCGHSVNVHTPEAIAEMLAQVVRDRAVSLPRLDHVQRVRELVDDYTNLARQVLA